jgi:hypothetical protein
MPVPGAAGVHRQGLLILGLGLISNSRRKRRALEPAAGWRNDLRLEMAALACEKVFDGKSGLGSVSKKPLTIS